MSCVLWGQRQLRLESVFSVSPVHGLRASATAGWMRRGVPWREPGFTERAACQPCSRRVRGESCGLFLWRGLFSRHPDMHSAPALRRDG